jgi:hypothetical protein
MAQQGHAAVRLLLRRRLVPSHRHRDCEGGHLVCFLPWSSAITSSLMISTAVDPCRIRRRTAPVRFDCEFRTGSPCCQALAILLPLTSGVSRIGVPSLVHLRAGCLRRQVRFSSS